MKISITSTEKWTEAVKNLEKNLNTLNIAILFMEIARAVLKMKDMRTCSNEFLQ